MRGRILTIYHIFNNFFSLVFYFLSKFLNLSFFPHLFSIWARCRTHRCELADKLIRTAPSDQNVCKSRGFSLRMNATYSYLEHDFGHGPHVELVLAISNEATQHQSNQPNQLQAPHGPWCIQKVDVNNVWSLQRCEILANSETLSSVGRSVRRSVGLRLALFWLSLGKR